MQVYRVVPITKRGNCYPGIYPLLLQEQIVKQEQDFQRLRLAVANLTDEKNKFKKQVNVTKYQSTKYPLLQSP